MTHELTEPSLRFRDSFTYLVFLLFSFQRPTTFKIPVAETVQREGECFYFTCRLASTIFCGNFNCSFPPFCCREGRLSTTRSATGQAIFSTKFLRLLRRKPPHCSLYFRNPPPGASGPPVVRYPTDEVEVSTPAESRRQAEISPPPTICNYESCGVKHQTLTAAPHPPIIGRG
jgi:hypothetical protein